MPCAVPRLPHESAFLRFTHASPEAVVSCQSRGSVGAAPSPIDHQKLVGEERIPLRTKPRDRVWRGTGAGQCPVPLAAAKAKQGWHKPRFASSPGPFGGRQAEPAPTCCRRTEHESVGHKSEPPDSSRVEDSGILPHKGNGRKARAPASRRNPCLHRLRALRGNHTAPEAVVSC